MTVRLKGILLAISLLAAVAFIGPKTVAQDTQNFSFDSFTADYRLSRASDRSSQLDVKETLIARFPGHDQNHGILRAVPQKYAGHNLNLKVISITDGLGRAHRYEAYSQNDNLVLKIGDPDKFVHGLVTYVIHYRAQDVIRFYESHDEFFWDINGDQWSQPFAKVTAHVHVPDTLQSSLNTEQKCFTGFFGSQSQNCLIERQNQADGILVTSSAENLGPNQTLSLAISFKPASFAKSQQLQRQELLNKVSLAVGAALVILLPLFAFWFMFRRWRQFGDDPKGRGVIIPQYEQPKGLDALTADYLYKQALRPTAISSMLIELATKGYVTIYEIPKKGFFGSRDYELELKKSPDDLPEHIRQVLAAVFPSMTVGSRVKLSELNSSSSRKALYEVMKQLEDDLAQNLHAKGYFIKNPHKVKHGYQLWSIVIFVVGIAGVVLIATTGFWPVIGACLGLILAAAVVFLFSHLMPARTEAGVEAYDHLLGLEDYIELAEADRLKFLQSPEGAEKISNPEEFDPKTPQAKVKLFEKLLPYAMLFGLEKQWAKQFQNIYTQPPDWYRGNWAAFNTAYLASSVGGFASASSPSFATPSSSGSGFGGGGGAGGGGGGGGGGGW